MKCENVPTTACAVAYDSHNCDGGWRLVIPTVSDDGDAIADGNCYEMSNRFQQNAWHFSGGDEIQMVHLDLLVQVEVSHIFQS